MALPIIFPHFFYRDSHKPKTASGLASSRYYVKVNPGEEVSLFPCRLLGMGKPTDTAVSNVTLSHEGRTITVLSSANHTLNGYQVVVLIQTPEKDLKFYSEEFIGTEKKAGAAAAEWVNSVFKKTLRR